MSRSCPLCHNKKFKKIFEQKFSNKLAHKIVVCYSCGFIFVANTSSQKYYNEYYKVMSNYEHERDHLFHEKYLKIIENKISKEKKILDIGCSTGHLLFLLKKNGFKNLYGIDPSPKCKKIAWEKYGVRVGVSSIDSFRSKIKYDLIILSAVIEHIKDLEKSMDKILSLLKKNGFLFISVPDAENFYKGFEEPFGEFSIEHINFFSSNYLFHLLKEFANVYIESDNKAIYSLWKRKPKLEEVMKNYIKFSRKKIVNIRKTINSIHGKIIVWGAGSLSLRLLGSTNLKSKVQKFVDKNENLIGTKISGIEVISPDEISKYKFPILISSFRFKREILEEIKNRRIDNDIITF